MTVAFELKMPHKGSWNGKWSGEDKRYIIIKTFTAPAAKEYHMDTKIGLTFRYRWDDGWEAEVSLTKVDYKESARLRKLSSGFYGYDWMVSSIITYGKIIDRSEQYVRQHQLPN